MQFVWPGVRFTLAPLAETLWIMRGQEFDPPIGCEPISTVVVALYPLTMVSFKAAVMLRNESNLLATLAERGGAFSSEARVRIS